MAAKRAFKNEEKKEALDLFSSFDGGRFKELVLEASNDKNSGRRYGDPLYSVLWSRSCPFFGRCRPFLVWAGAAPLETAPKGPGSGPQLQLKPTYFAWWILIIFQFDIFKNKEKSLINLKLMSMIPVRIRMTSNADPDHPYLFPGSGSVSIIGWIRNPDPYQ